MLSYAFLTSASQIPSLDDSGYPILNFSSCWCGNWKLLRPIKMLLIYRECATFQTPCSCFLTSRNNFCSFGGFKHCLSFRLPALTGLSPCSAHIPFPALCSTPPTFTRFAHQDERQLYQPWAQHVPIKPRHYIRT